MTTSITIKDVTKMTDARLKMVCDALYDETREIANHRPAHVMMSCPFAQESVDAPAFDNLNKEGWARNQKYYRMMGYNLTGKVTINGKGKHYEGKKADMQYERIPFVDVNKAMEDDWIGAVCEEM